MEGLGENHNQLTLPRERRHAEWKCLNGNVLLLIFFPSRDRCLEECAKFASDNLFFKYYGYFIFLPLFTREPLLWGNV